MASTESMSASESLSSLVPAAGREPSAESEWTAGSEWVMNGLAMRDHTFTVPLDHRGGGADGRTIRVFARECCSLGRRGAALPWIVFLQGGPGFQSPRPKDNGGWFRRLTQTHRILLLDQRGTGRSSLVNQQTLARFDSDEKKAEYLCFFRQDSIVFDCEFIRRKLVGEAKWALYGQSFGGFCIFTYLSLAPSAIEFALFTGGIPPCLRTPEEVYYETYQVCLKKNFKFYDLFPGDVETVREVAEYLSSHQVFLPNGDVLSTRRLRSLGLTFYGSGGFEAVHYLFESPWVLTANGKELSYQFLHSFMGAVSQFETNPLYLVLHEAIYVQGRASQWAAWRVLREQYSQYFDGLYQGMFLFTGEHVYPWMLEEISAVRSLRGAAEIIAAKEDWPLIYDIDALRNSTVPSSAVIYGEDMCVYRPYSEEIARQMPQMRVWITYDYEHNGSSVDGDRILGRLLDLLEYPPGSIVS